MPEPTDLPIKPFTSPKTFATWLAKHHAQSNGIWIKIAKKDSGIRSVTHAEALEVALCYGWIDGQRDRFDDEYFLQRFTPRRARSRWSKINREQRHRVRSRAGAMQPAGRAEVDRAKADGRWDAAYSSPKNDRDPRGARAAASRANAGGPEDVRDARQPQPLRGPVSHRGSQEAGDARAPREAVRRDAGEGRDDPPAPRTQALTDRDAFEDRGTHATLRELGEEGHGLDERTETVHPGLVDTRAESTAECAATTASTAPAATAVRSTTP